MIKFTKGLPPKVEAKQYIICLRNQFKHVCAWNSVENSFVIALLQCSEQDGKPVDSYFDAEYINDSDIVGWCEL